MPNTQNHQTQNLASHNHLSQDILSMNFLSNADFSAQRPDILAEVIALKNLRRVALGPDMTVVFEHPRLIWWHIQEMLRIENGGEAQLQEEWEVYSALMPSANSITLTLMIEIMDPIARKKVLSQRQGIEHDLFLEGAGFRIQSQPIDGFGCQAAEHAKSSSEAGGQSSWRQEVKEGDHSADMGAGASELTSRDAAEIGGENIQIEDGADDALAGGVLLSKKASRDGGHGERRHKGGPTSSVHFLRFPLTHGVRNAFALGEPVLSCHHPQALYRAPVSRPLWGALCEDMGVVPLKY